MNRPLLSELEAQAGEYILPKWDKLVEFTKESNITFGPGINVRYIPGAGFSITADRPTTPWRHAWRVGTPDIEDRVIVQPGMVNGQFPWVNRDLQVGDVDEENQPAMVQLTPKEDGVSFIAVGVNVLNTSGTPFANMDDNITYDSLRIQEIDELPNGLGSGGVLDDDENFGWYPLVQLQWFDFRIERMFQIVYHNLQHSVVQIENQKYRHYFFQV